MAAPIFTSSYEILLLAFCGFEALLGVYWPSVRRRRRRSAAVPAAAAARRRPSPPPPLPIAASHRRRRPSPLASPLTPRPPSTQVAVLRSAEISDAERSTTMAVFRLPLNVLVVVVLLLVPLLREEFVFGLAVRDASRTVDPTHRTAAHLSHRSLAPLSPLAPPSRYI